ncbi:MAG TPA: gluconate 2-dehydrogenase subunit 3 family protein [Chondromyces sp.]|nr:gluconate 2-dehydrogenase subunit 3 family protein [Chondromyces sp.]
MAEEKKTNTMTRRKFIRNSSLLAGGAIGGGLLGTLIGANLNDDEKKQSSNGDTGVQGTNTKPTHNQALMYFTSKEDFEVLSAATERIFPEDETGPGAIQLGVPYFIDHQLAGNYGHNTREYMQGPFYPGSDYQGYQTSLKRHQVFDEGIRGLKEYSQKKYKKKFTELEGEQQDAVLKDFEAGKVPLRGVTSKTFFSLLRSATIEGAYADPVYGGNLNMEGWKMKNFPGHQASYAATIDSKEFKKIEPQSLQAYHQH